ncbi:MAG: NAD(P)H-hydrate epimerase, partial [Actinomycetota bacterium]
MDRLPAGTLMQRAAAGLAARCARILDGPYGARVTLLVGGGDNGGDALYAGAVLVRRGARVDAILTRPD